MVNHTDWVAHLEAVDDMVLRSGTLKAAAAQIRRLQKQCDVLLSALRACDEAMSYMSEYDIPLTLPDQVKAAIAEATGENE